MYPKVQFERTVPKLKSISGKSIIGNLVTNWNTKSTNKHFRNNKDIVQSIWCNSTGFHRNPRNTKTRIEREIERGFTNGGKQGARNGFLSRDLKFRAIPSPEALSLTLSFSFSLWRNKETGRRGGRKRKGKGERDMTWGPTCKWHFCKINPPLVQYWLIDLYNTCCSSLLTQIIV